MTRASPPARGIVDAHQHFWWIGRHDYPWLDPALAIHRDFGLEDLRQVLGDIRATVLVQASPTMAETQTLIERAQQEFSEEETAKSAERMMGGKFDFDDFLKQIRQVKKLGPLHDLLGMLPGMRDALKDISPDMTEKQMKRTEAIISSMTMEERLDPGLLNASRKRRIAKGSGTKVEDINALINQFKQAQKFMKMLSRSPRGKLMGGLMGRR